MKLVRRNIMYIGLGCSMESWPNPSISLNPGWVSKHRGMLGLSFALLSRNLIKLSSAMLQVLNDGIKELHAFYDRQKSHLSSYE